MLNNEKRNLILKAAEKRFERLGYDLTTVDEIAKDLRIAKSGIFYYFKSKDDLYYNIMLKQVNSFFQQFDETFSQKINFITNFIHQLLNIKNNRKLIYTLLMNAYHNRMNSYENDIFYIFKSKLDNLLDKLFSYPSQNQKLLFYEIVLALLKTTTFLDLNNSEHLDLLTNHIIKIFDN